MWLTVGPWSSGRHAASCGAHHTSETSLAPHETTSPHPPVGHPELAIGGRVGGHFVPHLGDPWDPRTPFRMSSLLSLHFMNRTIFQLVLQLTEFT